MNDYSRRALVADIGGTNFRLAITDIDRLTIEHFALLSTGDFTRPQDAIERYLKTVPFRPEMVALALAGPVDNDTARLTNRPWEFTKADIQAVTGAETVLLINDFEALALAVPTLTDYDLHEVKRGKLAKGHNRMVVGPGTGLGLSGLLWQNGEWLPIASEGGHMSFGARDAAELELVKAMDLKPGVVTAERLLSGAGLAALYNALAGGKTEPRDQFSAARITKAAIARQNPVAVRALDQFVVWLARFASDMALAFGARGGIYIGGGIAPNIIPALESPAFARAFSENHEVAGFFEDIPVWVIKDGADAELKGAALALARLAPSTAPVTLKA